MRDGLDRDAGDADQERRRCEPFLPGPENDCSAVETVSTGLRERKAYLGVYLVPITVFQIRKSHTYLFDVPYAV